MMNLNVGVNNKKKLKALRKMTKIPKASYSNYYSYKYNGEPSYHSCNENKDSKNILFDNDFIKNSKSCLSEMMTDNKYKTLAIAGAGVSLGILGAYMLKRKH